MLSTEKIAEVRQIIQKAREKGRQIALVPTMGYLHEGHVALVAEAKKAEAMVVMSIFVNPLQFGPNEDYERYPRDLERDARMAEAAGVDLLFHPEAKAMYPEAMLATVQVGVMENVLCGGSRPGHFRGVATVVSKLFHIVQPDLAFFGLKDYQQYRILKKMVMDLNFPIEVIGVPTVREADGLAKSSRNVYLSPKERAEAVVLYQSLGEAAAAIRDGQKDPRKIEKLIRSRFDETSGRLDYVEVRAASDLTNVEWIDRSVVIAVAVYFSSTRLIDNLVVQA